MEMVGTYNYGLVAVSYLVASLASFVALDMAGRITANQGSSSRWWLFAGGTAMGVGIWSMHFIGMLAFKLPIPQGYDVAITLYSLLIAVAASAYALWLVSQSTMPHLRLLGGALILGAGIAAMHYTGMAAMRMQPGIDYDPLWFTLSIVVAMVTAGAALWITHHLRGGGRRMRVRLLAALVMGLAVVGMHYTGMAAARFPVGSICGAALGHGVSPQWLASLVGISSIAILGGAIVVSVLDRRMQERTTGLSHSLQQANEKLTYLALHDSLTGLPNRLLLEDRLGQAVEKARRSRSGFALLFMNLDGFKTINDAYGHPVGDRMLAQLASNIRDVARSQDTVARLGGDEFVLLMDDVDGPEDAAMVAEKLLQQARVPLDVGHDQIQISASVGIAMFPDDGTNARELMEHADAAMYHVKEQSRNGYGFFAASMNLGAHEHLALVQDLRMALARNELMLHFQPQMKAPDGPLLGVEALLRWQHPRHGLIMPDDFIPLAERNGLIIEIGYWVLDEACRQLALWHSEGHAVPSMAVNLSATQFRHAVLPERVRDTLRRHRLAPAALTLEVTESTAMHDPEHSLLILQELADIGVHISIDDFGTGYSSLMYLKKLPASELKIDRGFIKDLAAGSEDEAIVAAIIALGKTLNLHIIAEGVETQQQKDLLTQLGCPSLQGYHLGWPVDADQLASGWTASAASR